MKRAEILKVAQALGITVEPDEPELPERMSVQHITHSLFAHYKNGLVETVAKLTGSPNAHEVVDALVDAYNSRPRWRTGTPEDDCYCLVYCPLVNHQRRCSVAFWCLRAGLWTSTTGGEFTHVVTHWMPLPDPPKP